MRPAARVSAAIDILDGTLQGAPLERALTQWGRSNRYAGSRDRRAIRDLCYQAMRCKRSYAAMGQGMSGRGLMLGHCYAQGIDPATVFDGSRFGPAQLTEKELQQGQCMSEAEALDCPDWMLSNFRDALGESAEESLKLLQGRGPVTLRVNRSRATVEEVLEALELDGINGQRVEHVPTAILIEENAHKINASKAFLKGLVELQDASSQAAILALGDLTNLRVLDYCAGGGGKALAMADAGARVVASDISTARMADLPQRAARAGVQIDVVQQAELDPKQSCDLVFVDAPCSGSGTWRRTPETKWALTQNQLKAFAELQLQILSEAQAHCSEAGRLAYATCSIFREENEKLVARFLDQHPHWHVSKQIRIDISSQQDGFFLTIFDPA